LTGGEPTQSAEARALWSSVERVLGEAELNGVLSHKLGALVAWLRRQRGAEVPPALAAAERSAALARLTVVPLLERIRASCDGPLVVIKGPELARLYPGQARSFVDVDLLVPDAPAVQRSLRAAGFGETGEFYEDAHHLRPLKWPTLGLNVEVHKHPSWPKRLHPPRFDEILEAARPASAGVDGVLVPDPRQHALLVTAHAWKENPLGTMRDLVDAAAIATTASAAEIDATAADWGLNRIWHATRTTIDSLLEGRRLRRPLRWWAGHLEELRDRTVLEEYLRWWLQGFWKLPPHLALLDTCDGIRRQLRRRPGEGWGAKLVRSAQSAAHPRRARPRRAARGGTPR
jgi:Uncharacterised nucleotidyltransferase